MVNWDPSRSLSELLKGERSWHLYFPEWECFGAPQGRVLYHQGRNEGHRMLVLEPLPGL